MWQKLYWRNRQTSSHAALWTQAQPQRVSSRKNKISPTCLWRGSKGRLRWCKDFGIESNSRYRKYKDFTHMTCLTNPISQLSLDVSPIWVPLISNEVSKLQGRSAWSNRFFMCFYKIPVPGDLVFIPQMALAVGKKKIFHNMELSN
jgi:hypothetical protein